MGVTDKLGDRKNEARASPVQVRLRPDLPDRYHRTNQKRERLGDRDRPREAPIYGCPRFWGFEGPKSAQSLSKFWGFEGPESESLPEACPFLGI